MKKLIVITAVFAMVLGGIGLANGAVIFDEAYTGEQFVAAGESYYFHFDLWLYGNDSTNSSLTLTQDVGTGSDVIFDQATIYATLYL